MKKLFLIPIVICSIVLVFISFKCIDNSDADNLLSAVPLTLTVSSFLICSTIAYFQTKDK